MQPSVFAHDSTKSLPLPGHRWLKYFKSKRSREQNFQAQRFPQSISDHLLLKFPLSSFSVLLKSKDESGKEEKRKLKLNLSYVSTF